MNVPGAVRARSNAFDPIAMLADRAGGPLQAADAGCSFLGAAGDPLHRAADPVHAVSLFARSARDLGGGTRGARDGVREPANRLARVPRDRAAGFRPASTLLHDGGGALDAPDDLREDFLHLGGGVLGPIGEGPHLVRDDGEACAGAARLARHDRGVERQHLRLGGQIADGIDDAPDVPGPFHQVLERPRVGVDLFAQVADRTDRLRDRFLALARACRAGSGDIEHCLRVALRPGKPLAQGVDRPLRVRCAGRLRTGVLELARRSVEHFLGGRPEGDCGIAHLGDDGAGIVAKLQQGAGEPADFVLAVVREDGSEISRSELFGEADHPPQPPREHDEEGGERHHQDHAARGDHRERLPRDCRGELVGPDTHHQRPQRRRLFSGQAHAVVLAGAHAPREAAGHLVGTRGLLLQVVVGQLPFRRAPGDEGYELAVAVDGAEVADVAVRRHHLAEDAVRRLRVMERQRQAEILVSIENLQHRRPAALHLRAEAVRLQAREQAADERGGHRQAYDEQRNRPRDQRCPPLLHQGTAASYASRTTNSREGPGRGACPALYGWA